MLRPTGVEPSEAFERREPRAFTAALLAESHRFGRVDSSGEECISVSLSMTMTPLEAALRRLRETPA